MALKSLLLVVVSAALADCLEGPCDIFARGGTPCQAAHSVTRALFGAYTGSLYQVMRMADGAQLDIAVRKGSVGGVADVQAQDAFCGMSFCMVHRIYDQSPNGNHLDLAPPGQAQRAWDRGVNATAHRILIKDGNRHTQVYGALFSPGMGYRQDNTQNVAVGDAPETIYAVMNGRVFNDGCCFDYGNAETDNNDDGESTMEAVYFGNNHEGGQGAGVGPWVMADLENGLWAGFDQVASANTPLNSDFVTVMVKGDSNNHFALKGGDASDADGLQLKYAGPRPSNKKYDVMHKQGAIILGIGGDNSDRAKGAFYEGVMTSGFSSDLVDQAVQTNIAAAGYALAGELITV